MPVRVSYKKQFAVMTMLLLTFVIVIELGANFWYYNIYRCDFEDNEIFDDVKPEVKRQICLESIGYGYVNELIPWIESSGNLITTNSEGYRGSEWSKEKPENTFRIFTIGGSTTYGAAAIDNQTYPFYLQEMYDQSNLGFNVEVLNAGISGETSLDESNAIKKNYVRYDPDLFLVYDGINDARKQVEEGTKEYSSIKWQERWIEICEFGEQYQFDTIVTLQPTVGTGKKILTHQESEFLKDPLQQKILEIYPSYVKQIGKIDKQCSKTADLRGIFDNIEGPIYYDRAHVGAKGNQIIAKNMYDISLPFVFEGSKRVDSIDVHNVTSLEDINSGLISNDFDVFMEQIYQIPESIATTYKTIKVFRVIFEN